MGAKIKIEDRTAVIEGGELSATRVTACDLRAGAALIIAGLKAKGETQGYGVEHIDRGYEAIEEKLRGLGAEIFRIN
jgi:UDP-N-acetylglucosamine 1-carboxyvinyltransferase